MNNIDKINFLFSYFIIKIIIQENQNLKQNQTFQVPKDIFYHINSMNQQVELSTQKIIQCMAVIDIDPTLAHFKSTQQKWISSIQLFSDVPKQIKSGSKVLNIFFGLYLVINYCEKNRLPIYQIDFISQPGPEWIPIKMPYNLADKFVDSFLCYKTEELQLMEPLGDIDVINTQRKSHLGQDKQVVNLPNGYKVVSNPILQSFLIYKRMKSRLQQTFKPTILQFYPPENTINLGLIPYFCFPQGIKLSRQLKGFITFSFILTQQTGDRLYVTYLTFKQLLNQNLKSKLNVKSLDKIYYDKGLCLISKYKYSDQLSQCLQHLYRLSMSRNDQPFFKVAQNFVNQLKIPKEINTHGFSYSYNGCNIMFEQDQVLETVSEKSIYCMFKFLPLEQILTVFKAILYQRHVIFISQSKTVLGLAMQAFTSFLFPFKWQNVIIPIVPLTMKQYLTAPVPYLAGITTVQLIDPSIQTQAVIVLLDSGKIMNDEDMPPLPQKLYKQLYKRLQQFQLYDQQQVRQYLQNPQNTYLFKMMEVQHPQFKGLVIREAFYEFFITLMKNYKKYWRNKLFKDLKDTFSMISTEPQLINDMFKIQDFLSDLGMNKVGSFGYKFTEGTIFTAYLERRYQNTTDLVANFFDQCLQKKKNKKFQGPLFQKTQKIRYIVSKHPQPEKQKIFYTYQRFPSILAQPSSNELLHEQINLKIQEQEIFSQAQFLQFIYQENQLSQNFYQLTDPNEYKNEENFDILNILTNKNKELFLQMKYSPHNKDKRVAEIFKQVYQLQNLQINRIFAKWPVFSKKQTQVVFMKKIQYFNLKLQNKLGSDYSQKIISVWQGENLEIIIKGSLKIIICSLKCAQTSAKSMLKTSTVLSSSHSKKHTVTVYVPNFRIRQFLNKIFKTQGEQIFNFIHNRVKNGIDNSWTIQTLIDLKIYIEKMSQQAFKQ